MMQQRRVGRRFAARGRHGRARVRVPGARRHGRLCPRHVEEHVTPAVGGVQVGAGPHLAVLGFDEPVSASPTFLKLYDGAGQAVPGVATQGTEQRLRAGGPARCSLTAPSWRCGTSSRPTVTPSRVRSRSPSARRRAHRRHQRPARAGQASRGLGIGFGIDRALAFLGCLLFVGGLIFARFAWPEVLHRARPALPRGLGLRRDHRLAPVDSARGRLLDRRLEEILRRRARSATSCRPSAPGALARRAARGDAAGDRCSCGAAGRRGVRSSKPRSCCSGSACGRRSRMPATATLAGWSRSASAPTSRTSGPRSLWLGGS